MRQGRPQMFPDGSEINRPRRIRWSAVLVSLVLTPVAGYVAVGRWRRSLTLVGAEICYLLVCALAAQLLIPWLMYGAVAVAVLHWLVAIYDVARLSRRGTYHPAWTWVVVAGVATLGFGEAIARVSRAFLLESYETSITSMEPTVEPGEHVLVGKRLGRVHRGDVIVFDYPPNPQLQYVMRVAALAGETVTVEEGELLVNGQGRRAERMGVEQRKDPVMGEHTVERWREKVEGRTYTIYRRAGPLPIIAETHVPEGHVFVLGDNRENSNDSRTWGTLPLEMVRGHALFIWWSPSPDGPRWNRMNKRLE